MSSPPKSPIMEFDEQKQPQDKASVTTQVVASSPPKHQQNHPQTLAAPNNNPVLAPDTKPVAVPPLNYDTRNPSPKTVAVAPENYDTKPVVAPDTNNANVNDNNKSVVKSNADDKRDYFDSFPPGYRFCPLDEELIVYYLKKKVMKEMLPHNRITDVNLYRFNPEALAEKYGRHGDKEWYFFTSRDRKYRNGSRPNRAAGDGYWKATGADKNVKFNNVTVGFRKALVFYEGKPPKGDKTNWIMHEYRVNEPARSKKNASATDMMLDKCVLCRIYKKADKSDKSVKTRNRDEDHMTVGDPILDHDDHENDEENEAGLEMGDYGGNFDASGHVNAYGDYLHQLHQPFSHGLYQELPFSNGLHQPFSNGLLDLDQIYNYGEPKMMDLDQIHNYHNYGYGFQPKMVDPVCFMHPTPMDSDFRDNCFGSSISDLENYDLSYLYNSNSMDSLMNLDSSLASNPPNNLSSNSFASNAPNNLSTNSLASNAPNNLSSNPKLPKEKERIGTFT